MIRIFLLLVAFGCGASQGPERPTGANQEGEEALVPAGEGEPQAEGEAGQPDATREPAPIECADRDVHACAVAEGCVLSRSGDCREPANECEAIRLEHRGLTPVFDRGDPCQRANPGCAWSAATGLCAPFVAVDECPPTVEEASQLVVYCDHTDQSPLECSYRGTECSCRRASHCGGMAPPPELAHPPAQFSCVPDFDARGCPTSSVREGSRCRLSPDVQCQVGCYGLYTCERGRWRRRQLPPRP